MRPRRLAALLALWLTHNADAHPQPATLITLDIADDHVAAELHVPLPELELAFGHEVTKQPLRGWDAAFRDYVLAHFRPATPGGERWSAVIGETRVTNAEQNQAGSFQEAIVNLRLTPPGAAAVGDFVLHHDLILHQVVTHKALVSIRSHWRAGRVEPTAVGALFVDTANGRVAPLRIDVEQGGWFRGFGAMVALGTRHISEGTDHLLFLLVLLLPATLRVQSGRWGVFAGYRHSLWHLVRIVTAFTLGHSLTLMAGALEWVKLPAQPVEVLIAASVLLTAVHAIRPLFPGREGLVAALFGLVHGLAFATVLADLHLDRGPLAASILGFNLGIELMQLAVIALTVPWLMVLSLTPAHRYVRVGGASLAAVAACGWIWNRVTGPSNAIEHAMELTAEFAPLAIVALALIAIPAYWRTAHSSLEGTN
jgi:hypothetical protein